MCKGYNFYLLIFSSIESDLCPLRLLSSTMHKDFYFYIVLYLNDTFANNLANATSVSVFVALDWER